MKMIGEVSLWIGAGTVGLVGVLGLLIVASWLTGNQGHNNDRYSRKRYGERFLTQRINPTKSINYVRSLRL